MDWGKIIAKAGGVAMVVFGEIKDDLKDGKITVDEIIDVTKTIVDKLGYGGKSLLDLKSGNTNNAK